MTLRVIPVDLAEANELVSRWHRHHFPAVGHRFSLGACDHHGDWHGACITGRPVARKTPDRAVLEVTRLVTDGTKNACSILYAAAARAATAMENERIQTFILISEHGTSLRAAGWEYDGDTPGKQWEHTAGPRRTDQPNVPKGRWVKHLNPAHPPVQRITATKNTAASLFDAEDVTA